MTSDESKALYAKMQAEAEAKGLLRGRAYATSLAPDTDPKRERVEEHKHVLNPKHRRAQSSHEADHLRVERDVCFNCQVPLDKHDEVGCRQWRGTV